jgi:hypothetical protein
MTDDDPPRERMFRLLGLLWLTGVSMRVTISGGAAGSR